MTAEEAKQLVYKVFISRVLESIEIAAKSARSKTVISTSGISQKDVVGPVIYRLEELGYTVTNDIQGNAIKVEW